MCETKFLKNKSKVTYYHRAFQKIRVGIYISSASNVLQG